MKDYSSGNILVVGDWHRNTDWKDAALRRAATENINIIVSVGDIGYYQHDDFDHLRTYLHEHDMWLLFVDGNHDNHDLLATLPRDHNGLGVVDSNIRHIPRGATWTMNGKTWLGVGGAISINQNNLTYNTDWWPAEPLTVEQTKRALNHESVDVIVSHEAPLGCPATEQRVQQFYETYPKHLVDAGHGQREMLRALLNHYQPSHHFHGHYHLHHTHRIGDTLVVGLDKDDSTWDNHVWSM